MRAILICIALMALTVRASGNEESVFGFVLGGALTLPECPFKLSSSGLKMYELQADKTCVTEPRKKEGYKIPVRGVIFAQKERPSFMKSLGFTAIEEGGVLTGVAFLTWGASTQAETLAKLSDKYGRPQSLTTNKVSTAAGVTLEAITASWQKGRVSVSFEGVEDKIDNGEVVIDLPSAKKLRQTWLEEDELAQRPL